MITVLEIHGKRDTMDKFKVSQFQGLTEATKYVNDVNNNKDKKYYKYAEIIELGVLYEPWIEIEHKSIK